MDRCDGRRWASGSGKDFMEETMRREWSKKVELDDRTQAQFASARIPSVTCVTLGHVRNRPATEPATPKGRNVKLGLDIWLALYMQLNCVRNSLRTIYKVHMKSVAARMEAHLVVRIHVNSNMKVESLEPGE